MNVWPSAGSSRLRRRDSSSRIGAGITTQRPHSSLDNLTPSQFLTRWTCTHAPSLDTGATIRTGTDWASSSGSCSRASVAIQRSFPGKGERRAVSVPHLSTAGEALAPRLSSPETRAPPGHALSSG